MTVDDQTPHGGVRFDSDDARWTMWGEVDAAVKKRVGDDLEAHLLATADDPLTIDLAEVTFIDSGGLRLLYMAAEKKSSPPALVNVPTRVLDLLKLSGVDTLFVLAD
ncbi:STAS domain-containing protein [Isoptericola sp. b408]|uniref:STAS domain-containing protein n=1 Tax=Isoptericola sp. b408 TaxID=3064653 RepID=UPI0027135009|nr:STAS domain-containing protein [Isoptericola sp. b408]MDO8149910.1 STAS domain-containing protein [Isoptericola sp. b408]